MPMLLQVLPTPTGATPTVQQFVSGQTGNFQIDLANIIKAMRAQGDSQLATQFQTYALNLHAQQPTLSAEQTLSAFLAVELGGAIATGTGIAGTALGQIPGATAKGAENAIQSLGGFNLSSWFLRIGEILLGLVLVGVGVARITGAANFISSAVKAKVPI